MILQGRNQPGIRLKGKGWHSGKTNTLLSSPGLIFVIATLTAQRTSWPVLPVGSSEAFLLHLLPLLRIPIRQ